MAYTWGTLLGGSNDGDPRRGTFSTGAEYNSGAAAAVSWPTNSPAPVANYFRDNLGAVDTNRPNFSLGFDLGSVVSNFTGGMTPAAQGINTAQIDGKTSFADALAGLSRAVLGGIGATDGGSAAPAATPVFYQAPQSSGVDIQTIAIVGLVAFGIYYLTK